MHQVSLDLALNSPPEDVWAVVGPFGSLGDWHPFVARSVSSVDAQGRELRTLELIPGISIVERLLEHNDEAKLYRYTFVSGPMPVRFFNGEFQVVGSGGQSRVRWTATFEVIEGAPETEIVERMQYLLTSAEPALTARFGAA